MKCINCGSEIAEGSKFCPNCGASQLPQKKVCPNCGTELDNDAMFCPECGTNLSASQTNNNFRLSDMQEKVKTAFSGQPSGTNMVVTVVAMIFAVIIGLLALSRIGNVFGSVRWGIYFGELFGFALSLFALALVTLMFVLFALKRSENNTTGLLILLGLTFVLNLIVQLLAYLITGYFKYGYYGIKEFIPQMIWPFAGVVVLFVVLLVIGNRTILDLDMSNGLNSVLAEAMLAVDDVQSSLNAPKQEKARPEPNVYVSAEKTADGAKVTIEANNGPRPAYAIATNRGLFKYIIFTILTCGIYSYWFVYSMARDVNEMCKEDGDKTGGLLVYILLSIITCGFYSIYWEYKLANRLQENGPRYGINFSENGTSVLLWIIFGALICGVGPFIAMNILIKNTNRLAREYNRVNGF